MQVAKVSVDPSGVRAIIVEDEFIVAADIQSALTQMGHTVVGHCATFESCLTRTAELMPDVILMDINLGGRMRGIDAALEIRERHGLPVIFLTAYADEQTIARAKVAQPAGYLIKPYRPAELRVAIEMAMYKHRLAQRADQAQQQVRVEEERFRTLFERAGVGIALLDVEGGVVECNATLCQMLGFDSLRGRGLAELSTDPFADTERALFRSLMRGERDQYTLEVRYLRAGGDLGWGGVTGSMLASASGRYAIRILSDISPKRLAQVAHFQETERRLMSTELHDAVSQPLAGIFYRLQLVEQLQSRDGARAAEELAGARTQAKALLDDVSRLIENLRSPLLDGASAADAVRGLVNALAQEASLAAELVVPDEIAGLGRLRAFFLYRIVQESLVNIRRHAEATRVKVHLHIDGPWLEGEIVDNGRGAAAVPDASRAHYGIRGMRERAELVGGWLDVIFGRGTRVSFRLPLEGQDGL
ncbi:MAG: response regulator [Proteobacteria bacterium]|nr:response regulator [Pseudomonadota bacterium]